MTTVMGLDALYILYCISSSSRRRKRKVGCQSGCPARGARGQLFPVDRYGNKNNIKNSPRLHSYPPTRIFIIDLDYIGGRGGCNTYYNICRFLFVHFALYAILKRAREACIYGITYAYLPATDLTVFRCSHRSGAWPLPSAPPLPPPSLHTTIRRLRPPGRCARGSRHRRRCTRFSVRRVAAMQRRRDVRVLTCVCVYVRARVPSRCTGCPKTRGTHQVEEAIKFERRASNIDEKKGIQTS